MVFTQHYACMIYCHLVCTNTCKLPHTHSPIYTHSPPPPRIHTHTHTHDFTGDSDCSEVTETLLLEAQEQATKNNVHGEDDGEAEEEEVGEGMCQLYYRLYTAGSVVYSGFRLCSTTLQIMPAHHFNIIIFLYLHTYVDVY